MRFRGSRSTGGAVDERDKPGRVTKTEKRTVKGKRRDRTKKNVYLREYQAKKKNNSFI